MPLGSRSLGELLDDVARRTQAPGGGSAAAIGAALAAALVAMAAGFSDATMSDSPGVVARCVALRGELERLADADLAAFEGVLVARRRPRDDDRRPAEIAAALSTAADVPLVICELAAQVAGLAALVIAGGNPNLRGDAVTAALLAEASARAAGALVRINLEAGSGDVRLARVAGAIGRAGQAASASWSALSEARPT